MSVLVVKMVFVYSVLHTMFILCCSSMQLNHPLIKTIYGNETDRLALLAIKAQIHHDPNRTMSSWNDSIHFCLWRGVTCGRIHRQRVIKLNLTSQGLAGSISPHIGNLTFLRYLLLSNNSFTKQIPLEIGRLRRLQELSIANNLFTGTIPTNISNCSNLTFLHFGNNKLVGEIPWQIGFLSKLQILVLQINNLTGEIPHSLGNLSSLEVLGAARNNLVGRLPSSLDQLKKLTFLSLVDNMLSDTIPPSIFNLSELVQISVSRNQLHGSIPSFLRFAPHLEIFHLSQNNFTGNIPLSIANATNLKSFFFGHNNLTGQVPNLQKLHKLVDFSITGNSLGSDRQGDLSFISELVNASHLRWLEIGYNIFGGTLPTSISNLTTNLDTFWLPGNKLHGSIPTSIGNLVNLQSLGMWGNYFTGSIPTEIGKLSNLVELYFDSNKLSSSIPPSLGNLTKLNILYLYGNNLNGSIPPSLGNCQRLLDLDLSENKLDGTIPPQLLRGLLSLSISLYLFANRLTGSLPMEIGNLKSLSALDVCDNMLSGQLPSSLGNCEILDVLHLQGNFFQGSIPSSMNNLRGLRDLDLSRNNFSGNIPEFFKGFRDLVNLNLSFNNFWGQVPTEGVFENASAISVVGNTRLCGGISNLRLPMCHPKGGLSHRIRLMICLVSGFTLAVVLLSFFLIYKRRKETQSCTSENSTWQVSYATLLKATNDFSSMNLIGVGAFGSVYKGILYDDGVTVAVKVFNMLHHGASKSFMAECEALKNIRHRNLVKILTACSSIDFKGNDFKALVYEFMENGSLEEWLHPSTENKEVLDASTTLSLVQRLDIVIDVASALDYLHNHCETPIVHCDLKPSNVLLGKEFTGHVSDFGLAKFLSNSTGSDSANQSSSIGIRGSVGYASPEYGMGSEVSTNGDVYSFGILLLEMLTGKRPTDHMFSDGLNLHNYVKAALQVDGCAEIVDSLAFQEDVPKNFDKIPDQCDTRGKKMEECLTLIFGIGIACSAECPTNRKGMGDVVYELKSIRDNLLA